MRAGGGSIMCFGAMTKNVAVNYLQRCCYWRIVRMEGQETSSSETHLDFSVLPDVPLLRVLDYLPGLQIEKCRGISRLFHGRIDMNRKSLPTVQVEPTVFITIFFKDRKPCWRRYGAAPLKKALKRFDHMFPRMQVESLHLELEYFDDTTFHQLLKRFEDFNVKCKNLLVVTEGQKFQWKDLRSMLLQLEPENFSFMLRGENTPLTSSFWQDKCIRDRQELCISAKNVSFDDQVLLNFASLNYMLGRTACTFNGIASFLNEWKAGTREVTKIRLWVQSDLNIRAFFAMLSWNVKIPTSDYGDDFEYHTVITNSLGKKLELWIEEITKTKDFCFEMMDDDYYDGLYPSWDDRFFSDHNQYDDRLRLRDAPAREFLDFFWSLLSGRLETNTWRFTPLFFSSSKMTNEFSFIFRADDAEIVLKVIRDDYGAGMSYLNGKRNFEKVKRFCI
ncbi:unnamed protein product, partial [Mesorhabditis belari]|uniref:F-box domain-containing protein n=1 Tax=Mesorhabditis belari TaxID=2138241 RepID=A0AAF3FEY9_9BILA